MITEQIDLVECSPCSECGVWIVLRLATYDPELELYEFTCPRCGAATGTVKRKTWRLPRSVEQNGHFTLDEYDKLGQKHKSASSPLGRQRQSDI
jgi:hypothetical protein